ncbi:uncharacterized protein LOC120351594 [Nilaparvata lugens]|uniref:uncharacterized protein LOC120351594 n=1 Tax=Nilaparvata lugens TaxID=108931 RepID=UPI00193E2454|nr:uncharacterized protein LOC120351594 [Nilaparvata lugens]
MVCVKKEYSGTCSVECNTGESSVGECSITCSHLPENACKSEPNESRIEALRSSILQRAATENTPYLIIFQEEINKAPVEIRNALNFKRMEWSMQRFHTRSNPGSVEDFKQFEIEIKKCWSYCRYSSYCCCCSYCY